MRKSDVQTGDDDRAGLCDVALGKGRLGDKYILPMAVLCSISHQLLRGMYEPWKGCMNCMNALGWVYAKIYHL